MAELYDINALTKLPKWDMEWFTKALTGGNVLRRRKIGFIPGVNGEQLLNQLVSDGKMLQDGEYNCDWNPTKYAKLTEKKAFVKPFTIQKDFCARELYARRTNLMLTPGANFVEIPSKLEDATMYMAQKDLSNEVEIKIFTSDTSKGETFDGAVSTLTKSTESIQLKGVQLNKSNIVDELDKVMANSPEDVIADGMENGTLVFYVSAKTIMQLKLASASIFNGSVVVSQHINIGETVSYMGIELVAVKGLDDSTIIFADIRNFYLVTDLISDTEYFRVGRYPAPQDSKIYVDGYMQLGFVIPFEDEVVFYSSAITEDRPAKAVSPATQSIETKKGGK